MDLTSQLRHQVEQATGSTIPDAPVLKLKGDASNRSYYRVGVPPHSNVVMVMPGGASSISEEATKGDKPDELPFVNVHRYLKSLGIRVPEILRFDEPAGVMVLEDLSDLTFEKALETGDKRALYRQAVELLAHLRARAERDANASCIAFTRAFDADLYEWEFHHFREFGLEAWSGRKPSSDERVELDSIFRQLSTQLAAAPRGFTHRDYQSRNLMVKDGELVVIDFQDALQGPRQYDLVALLRASYVELVSDFVDEMLEVYIDAFRRETKEQIDPRPFKSFFHLLTVQRKLKDAGRFEYIHRVKNNSSFLVSIPASLRYVKAAFDRQPELNRLRKIVSAYVPELG